MLLTLLDETAIRCKPTYMKTGLMWVIQTMTLSKFLKKCIVHYLRIKMQYFCSLLSYSTLYNLRAFYLMVTTRKSTYLIETLFLFIQQQVAIDSRMESA